MEGSWHEKSKSLNGVKHGRGAYVSLASAVMPQGHLQGHHTAVSSPGLSSLPSGQSSSTGQGHSGLAWSHGSKNLPMLSSEGSPVVSQSHSSRSSVVLCPGDRGSCIEADTSSASACNSGSGLKEHDYIGLAEVSSPSVMKQVSESEKARQEGLNLEETDLRLWLGPPDVPHSSGANDTQVASHAPKVASQGYGAGVHGLSGGFNGSLALGANNHGVSDGRAASENQAWASEQQNHSGLDKASYSCADAFVKNSAACMPLRNAQDDSRKDLAWFEKSHNGGLGIKSNKDPPNIQWSKPDSHRERQVSSQCPSQLAAWSGHDVRFPSMDNSLDKRSALLPETPSSQHPWQAHFAPNMDESRVHVGRDVAALHAPVLPGQEFDSARSGVLSAPRAILHGVKRGYSKAMVDIQFSSGDPRNGMFDGVITANGAGQAAPAGASIGGKNGLHLSEVELKQLSQYGKYQTTPSMYSASGLKASSLTPWQVGYEETGGMFGSFASTSNKPTGLMTIHTDMPADSGSGAWDARSKAQDCLVSMENQQSQMDNQHSATNDAPPPKGQVVGWPPIRSFRKNTLVVQPKTAGDGEGAADSTVPSGHVQGSSNSLYVKVNMDGVPIGRKVDLNVHKSYEGLSLALEEMFQRCTNGQGVSQVTHKRENFPSDPKQLRLLTGSDYVLTYEDKEGDWMLVGDVPWGMFANTVRRLRIMKGSEATGLAPRGSEKSKCRA